MRIFFAADLTAQGELQQVSEYDYATLERVPGFIDIISRCSRRRIGVSPRLICKKRWGLDSAHT